jgi:hypothetical protein
MLEHDDVISLMKYLKTVRKHAIDDFYYESDQHVFGSDSVLFCFVLIELSILSCKRDREIHEGNATKDARVGL